MPTLIAILKTVMKMAKMIALMALKKFMGLLMSLFYNMIKHGIKI